MKNIIEYWAHFINNDLKTFRDVNYTINYLMEFKESLVIAELEGKQGVMCCLIHRDWQGIKNCAEIVMYIKPEHRGNIRLFKKLIKSLEIAAQSNKCEYITIGADIGYRDNKLLNLLNKIGYEKDTLRKRVSNG